MNGRKHAGTLPEPPARERSSVRGKAPLRLPVLLATALLSSTACASMQQRVTEAENRSQTLEAQVADLQATQEDIINTITMLRADLEAALDPIRAQQASGGADLRTLQGQISNLQEQVRILSEQLAAYEAAGSAVAAETPAQPGVAMPPAGGAAAGGAPPAADSVASDTPDEQLFNAAYRDYTAGQFVLAIGGFEELVAQYPDSPRAPDALYWIGESLAAQEQHAEARRRFLEVTQRYPGAPKVADAVLRAALEAVELGQIDDAVRELLQLVAAHTNTDAALIGCMQLDRLGEALPEACRLPGSRDGNDASDG